MKKIKYLLISLFIFSSLFFMIGCKEKECEHEYKYDRHEATCTEKGVIESYCSKCGIKGDTQYLPKLDHDFIVEEGYEATCTFNGYTDKIYCGRCGYVKQEKEEILASHDLVIDKGYEPTCTEWGLSDGKHCTKCSYVEEGTYIEPTHNETIIPGKDATCGEPGYTEGSYCSVCNEILTESNPIQATEKHNFIEHNDCSVCGTPYYTLGANYYLSDDETGYLVAYEFMNNLPEEVYLPTYYNGKPVIGLAYHAFYEKDTIKKIVFSDNIKVIGGTSIYHCDNLETLVFNSAIEEYQSYGISSNDNLKYVYYNGSIADWCNIKFAGAFIIYSLYNPSKMDYFYVADQNGDVDYNNKKYSRVLDLVIPEGVTKINNYVFSTFKFLNSVSLPSTLQEIGDYCFSDCTGIKEINIPANVKKLGNGTFSDCTGIEKITLPNTLNELGNNVFSGCTNLVTANIPTVLESISGGLFRDCTSLTNITIPRGVTKIGASAFYNCESITSIEIPALVTEIGSNAFYGTSIKTITLPNVVTMGYGVFEQCKLLESIHIPGSLVTLPNSTFKNCSQLKTVTFDTNHTASNDENGIYIKFTIGWEAFCCCTSLETITLPSYCEGINDSAFISCENLTTVNLPLKDTINQTYDFTIGKQAFASCVKLQSIILPKGSHIIDELAFFNCYKLSYIVIPAGVEQIKANAFNGCYSLDKIYYELDEIDYAMIEIDPTNTALTDNKIYYYSKTEKTDGQWWYYVDWVPTEW